MQDANNQNFIKICRANGWKCTPQRMAVYGFIYDNRTHPDVDTVWAHVKRAQPAITRESIYRILNEFASHGLIRRLGQFENAHYDGQVGSHGHFICTRCGAIQDFVLPEGFAFPQNAVSGDVDHLELRLTGICGSCKNKEQQRK